LEEKKLMTIYVTKSQYEEILRHYGDEIIPPKYITEGLPVSNAVMTKRSPIGLDFKIK
jgi:hypothetical protein